MDEICRFRNKNTEHEQNEAVRVTAAQIRRIEKRNYWKKVWELTESIAHLIPGIEKGRAFKGYHIDHIIPVSHGYKHGVNPEKIAHISNLRMLPYKENMAKGIKLYVNKQIKIVF